MADQTVLGPVSGPDKNLFSGPVDAGGKLGRYTVAIGEGASSKAEEATHSVVVYTEKVSILDRIMNWITGALDKEKNQALVGFIETGEAKVFSFATESLKDGKQETGSLVDRLSVFEKLMAGKTGAKIDEKKAACEVFGKVIDQAWKSNDAEMKEAMKGALSQILHQTEDANLRFDILGLQHHLETGLPLGAGIDELADGLDIDGDIVDDEIGIGSSSFVIEDEDLFDSGAIVIPGEVDDIAFVEPRNVPTPLADALDGLAEKIKASDGTEHPAIAEMKDLLESGTQPVVLLEKLEKLYDSSSVKYNDASKLAVREAAKEIYDKGMHGQSVMSHQTNRIVDALVGLDFKGVNTMGLSYGKSPLKL